MSGSRHGPEGVAVWAAFDFDGTLRRGDSLVGFLRDLLGPASLGAALACEAPWLLGYAAGWVGNDVAKQRLLRRCLRGQPLARLQQAGQRFAVEKLPRGLRAPMIDRLRAHQAAGHHCVLVTASPSLYTAPWAHAMGFRASIGTELEFDPEGRASGRFDGLNCWGPEKARRLRELLGGQALDYAYGDTRGDREMLAMARRGWLVGRGNGWGERLPSLERSPRPDGS
jgi:phosphatidylglycerophosphatase C